MSRSLLFFASSLAAACGLTHGLDELPEVGGDRDADRTDAGPAVMDPRDAGPHWDPPDAFRGLPDAGGDPDADHDAAPIVPPEADGVRCGEEVCVGGIEACRATCRFGTSPSPVCVVAPEGWEIGDCPSDETFPIVVARCDGPEDCGAGEHCGILLGSGGNYPQCLACDDTAECVSPGGSTLCHTPADCPAWASTCRPDVDLLQGFYDTCAE